MESHQILRLIPALSENSVIGFLKHESGEKEGVFLLIQRAPRQEEDSNLKSFCVFDREGMLPVEIRIKKTASEQLEIVGLEDPRGYFADPSIFDPEASPYPEVQEGKLVVPGTGAEFQVIGCAPLNDLEALLPKIIDKKGGLLQLTDAFPSDITF